MNKKILVLLAVILISISAVFIIINQKQSQNREVIKQELVQKFQLLKSQYDAVEAEGYDVVEVKRLAKEAKIAFDEGDYKKANELLISISKILVDIELPVNSVSPSISPNSSPSSIPTNSPVSSNIPDISSYPSPTISPVATILPSPTVSPQTKESDKEKLFGVKVATIYERLADGALINRNTADVANILSETKTEFVFRAWWRFHPIPESATDSGNGFFTSAQLKEAADTGNTYQDLKKRNRRG